MATLSGGLDCGVPQLPDFFSSILGDDGNWLRSHITNSTETSRDIQNINQNSRPDSSSMLKEKIIPVEIDTVANKDSIIEPLTESLFRVSEGLSAQEVFNKQAGVAPPEIPQGSLNSSSLTTEEPTAVPVNPTTTSPVDNDNASRFKFSEGLSAHEVFNGEVGVLPLEIPQSNLNSPSPPTGASSVNNDNGSRFKISEGLSAHEVSNGQFGFSPTKIPTDERTNVPVNPAEISRVNNDNGSRFKISEGLSAQDVFNGQVGFLPPKIPTDERTNVPVNPVEVSRVNNDNASRFKISEGLSADEVFNGQVGFLPPKLPQDNLNSLSLTIDGQTNVPGNPTDADIDDNESRFKISEGLSAHEVFNGQVGFLPPNIREGSLNSQSSPTDKHTKVPGNPVEASNVNNDNRFRISEGLSQHEAFSGQIGFLPPNILENMPLPQHLGAGRPSIGRPPLGHHPEISSISSHRGGPPFSPHGQQIRNSFRGQQNHRIPIQSLHRINSSPGFHETRDFISPPSQLPPFSSGVTRDEIVQSSNNANKPLSQQRPNLQRTVPLLTTTEQPNNDEKTTLFSIGMSAADLLIRNNDMSGRKIPNPTISKDSLNNFNSPPPTEPETVIDDLKNEESDHLTKPLINEQVENNKTSDVSNTTADTETVSESETTITKNNSTTENKTFKHSVGAAYYGNNRDDYEYVRPVQSTRNNGVSASYASIAKFAPKVRRQSQFSSRRLGEETCANYQTFPSSRVSIDPNIKLVTDLNYLYCI